MWPSIQACRKPIQIDLLILDYSLNPVNGFGIKIEAKNQQFVLGYLYCWGKLALEVFVYKRYTASALLREINTLKLLDFANDCFLTEIIVI